MIERVRNVEKAVVKAEKRKSEGSEQPVSKRSKVDKLIRRYPVTISSEVADPETMEQHHKAIEEEMKKAKPRDRILLPLMKATFQNRLLYIRKDASCVNDILQKYPCFKFPLIVSSVHIIVLTTYFKAIISLHGKKLLQLRYISFHFV